MHSTSEKEGARLRRFTSLLCLVLGVVFVTLGIVISALSNGLFDSDGFADRVAASLDDPRVAELLADRIATAVVSEEPDLMPFRPLLVGTAQGLVGSNAFRALARTAARRAHARLLSEGGRQVLLSVPDVGVLLQSALSAAKPELAEKIPRRAEALLGSTQFGRGASYLVDFWQIGRRLARLSRRAIALGAVLILLGIAVSRPARRRQAIWIAGTSLVVAGALLVVLLPLGRLVVESFAKEDLLRRGLAGLWHTFTAPLRTWAVLLAGFGLLIDAAGSSLLEKVDAGIVLRRVRRLFVDPPGGRLGRLGRTLLILGIGLLALLSPGSVVRVVTLVAGALLLFVGLLELFRLLLSLVPEEAATVSRRVHGPGRTVARAAIIATVAGLIGLGGVLWSGRTTTPPPRASSACNGSPELCDRRLEEVVFPSTHNAMSSADVQGWMFPQQERGIAGQLEDGIRALMLDAHYGRPVGDHVKTDIEAEEGSIEKYTEAIGQEGVDAAMRIRDRLVGQEEGSLGTYLCHGFCELGATPLAQALREIHAFLVQNPNEVLIVVIEDYVHPQEIGAAFEKSGLVDLVYRGPAGPPWPTLRELIASGQRVLVLSESGRPGIAWLHPAFEVLQETPYGFHAPEEFSCDPNRGGTSGSLFLVNHWIETAPTPLPSNAAIVNTYDFLLKRVQQCQKARGRRANIVAVDFYRTGDLFRVVRTLNGLDAPSVAAATH